MKTLKALGGALLAIVIMIASSILASLISSGLLLLNIPEWICIAFMGILYAVIALIAVKLIYGRAFKYSLSEFGMKKPSVKLIYILPAVLLPAAVCGAFFLFAKGEFVPSSMEGSIRNPVLAEGIFYNSIGAAIVEEVLFRGMMLNVLKKRWNTVAGVIVPSVLFAAIHITEMQEFNLPDCVQLLAAGTFVGIMFSVIALKSGSVWNSVIVHSIWNLVMTGGILYIGSEASETALVNYVLDSKSFALTGGAFGIESSAVAIAAYVVVVLAVFFGTAGRKQGRESSNERQTLTLET